MINIVLADDHSIVRSGLKNLVENLENVTVLKECSNGLEVMDFVKEEAHIHLVIADLNMPEMGGLELTLALKRFNPKIKVVILSMYDDISRVATVFQAGADAYLLKSADMEELAFAIKVVNRNRKYIATDLTDRLIETQLNNAANAQSAIDPDQYSEREFEVLQLIAEGLTNLEISTKLFLSKRTIEGHRQSLLQKSRSNNTAALIRYAAKNGLIK
jgi:two-component system response regulator NreC